MEKDPSHPCERPWSSSMYRMYIVGEREDHMGSYITRTMYGFYAQKSSIH